MAVIKCNVNQCEYNKNNKCTKDNIEIDLSCDEYEYAYCSNYKESRDFIRRNYGIQQLNNQKYNCIVFSKNYMGVQDYLKEIAEDIKNMIDTEEIDEVSIVIDNLLHSGNNSNRYFEFLWDYKFNKMIEINIINVSKHDELRKNSIKYYTKHMELVENSILNSSQKALIKKGIII